MYQGAVDVGFVANITSTQPLAGYTVPAGRRAFFKNFNVGYSYDSPALNVPPNLRVQISRRGQNSPISNVPFAAVSATSWTQDYLIVNTGIGRIIPRYVDSLFPFFLKLDSMERLIFSFTWDDPGSNPISLYLLANIMLGPAEL